LQEADELIVTDKSLQDAIGRNSHRKTPDAEAYSKSQAGFTGVGMKPKSGFIPPPAYAYLH